MPTRPPKGGTPAHGLWPWQRAKIDEDHEKAREKYFDLNTALLRETSERRALVAKNTGLLTEIEALKAQIVELKAGLDHLTALSEEAPAPAQWSVEPDDYSFGPWILCQDAGICSLPDETPVQVIGDDETHNEFDPSVLIAGMYDPDGLFAYRIGYPRAGAAQ